MFHFYHKLYSYLTEGESLKVITLEISLTTDSAKAPYSEVPLHPPQPVLTHILVPTQCTANQISQDI